MQNFNQGIGSTKKVKSSSSEEEVATNNEILEKSYDRMANDLKENNSEIDKWMRIKTEMTGLEMMPMTSDFEYGNMTNFDIESEETIIKEPSTSTAFDSEKVNGIPRSKDDQVSMDNNSKQGYAM